MRAVNRILMFLSVVGVTGVSLGETPVLARNLDFENGFSDWRKPSRMWSVQPGAGYNGSKGLVWECDDKSHYEFPAQDIAAEPYAAYRVSALVKIDSLQGGKAQFGVEWTDRNGKWLAGSYAAPVDDNGILKDGWVRYEATTRSMPPNVGKCSIVCMVGKGSTGRVRYDDLTVEKVPQAPISYLISSAFRDCADKGKVRVLASIHANPENTVAELACARADGSVRVLRPSVFTADRALFELDVSDLAVGHQKLGFSLKEKSDGKVIATRELGFTRLAEPLKRRVTFDGRRMLLDGKPWFPLGLYTGRMTDEDIREYARGPFNFACQYGRITVEDLDRWQRAGVYVATDVRSLIYGYDYSAKSRLKTLEDSRAAFRKLYAKIGRHPALLMWYLNDEAPVKFAENTSRVNELLHEIDPDRATLTCLCQPKTAFDFLPSYDVMAHDCYPIGNHVGKSMLERVTRQMREIDENMMSMRPLWFIPQAMDWKWYYKGESLARCDQPYLRMPTREEMANMTWQSVACGANGIVSYAYSSIRKHLKGEEYEKAWGDVCSVGFEVKKMEPVLLSDDLPVEKTSGLPVYVVVRAWRHDGSDWYLVVNATREPQTAKIALPESRSSLETPVGGGVTLAADGRALDCALPPAGYAFVRVGK